MLPSWINAESILVRISKEDQQSRREKIGGMYLNPHQVFLKQNMQCGEILKIGNSIEEYFDIMRVGQTALFHHFIEGSMQNSRREQQELNSRFLLYEDDNYRYYIVPKIHLYGIELPQLLPHITLLPTPDYYFAKPIQISDDNDSSVILAGFKQSRNDVDQKLERLKQEALWLASGRRDPGVVRAIQEKEKEMEMITQSLNRKKFVPYRITVDFIAWYDQIGEAPTGIEYNGEEYFVLRRKHVGFLEPVN